MIDETIDLLGHKATDKVSGFTGTITSVCFDLYGCVQAIISPPMGSDGKIEDSRWFDVQRLDVTNEVVMPVPDFRATASQPAQYNKGGAAKPLP